ncbi:arylsulfatase [Polaribacter sp. BAL334]|uniref:sulfatase family protein n=1 Tax=Polaribacter sp. BAL334 TaxID=1708178 RepID=UPI0018D26917|nr:arylsulfatase [Polaribacter sp. BAL334]MBG7613126.1 arylsulfatase [Polaribacter sp. BAL334]
MKLVKSAITLIILIIFSSCAQKKTEAFKKQPNIVIIYLDDLGYGDLSSYGATELSTPNIDALANGGVRFTNGYATSATCTPSRYGLLTGVYPWRNKDAKILPGTAPLLIGTDQMTIATMLKKEGYQTGAVGKWHLGLGTGIVDWNKEVTPGPNQVGFEYSYIMAATQDRVPTVYIDNGFVDGLDPNDPIEVNYDQNFEGQPTGKDNPELLRMKWHHGHNSSIVNGIPRIGYMKGGESAKWTDEDMADHFLKKAQTYVKNHKEKPFFLYYAMQQPHVPRTPHKRFIGATKLGPRGDVIAEADWAIGQFMKTLKEEGILENTLVIFTSDNGPVLNDGYYDDAIEKLGNHKPSGPLRGGKYSLFEAGVRVPFITYWKGKIKATTSDALVCQLDLLNSIAALVGSKDSAKDSQNLLATFMGETKSGREELVIEATTRTAFRKGDWLLIPPYKGNAILSEVNIEIGNSDVFQLYNLKDDVGQQNNLAASKPILLQELIKSFEAIRGLDYKNVEKVELK